MAYFETVTAETLSKSLKSVRNSSWTLRYPDSEGEESAVPFSRRRASFMLRDRAHQSVPCHIMKENRARCAATQSVLSALPRALFAGTDLR